MQTMMHFSRKSERARNARPSDPTDRASTPRARRADGDPGPAYYVEKTKDGIYTPLLKQGRRPRRKMPNGRPRLSKTTSSCTATTGASSSRSLRSTESSHAEPDACPVTGLRSHITDDYYVCPRIIGKGHYGIVRECIHLATRRRFAVKSVDKSRVARLDDLRREVCLLADVDHPGIMKMVDCYEDADDVHIITDKYGGGELFERIVASKDSRGCFSERRAAAVIKSLLEAVAYLHDNDIVHRDVKPENVLFESEKEDAAVRLVDFGLSRRHRADDDPMTNVVGTPYYMSPEVLGGRYDRSCDVWATGVVAYILLCGFPPFNGGSDREVRDATLRGRLRFEGGRWLNKSDDAIDFVRALLRRDPSRRPTAAEALEHPWISNMTSP